jgi:hypothetical protein
MGRFMEDKVIKIQGIDVKFDFNNHSTNFDTIDPNVINKIQEDKEFIKWHEFLKIHHKHENGLLDKKGRESYIRMLEDIVKENIDKNNNSEL